MRFAAIVFMACLCFSATSLGQENDKGKTEPNTENDDPYSSTNFGIFAHLGHRSTGCDASTPVILNFGTQLQSDILVDEELRSLFVRGSMSVGILSSFDVGLGAFLSERFNVCLSYAFIASPECVAHNQSTRKLKTVNSSFMVSIGLGRSGFLFECNLYIFFEEELYDQFAFFPFGDDFVETSKLPTAFAVRFGYVF